MFAEKNATNFEARKPFCAMDLILQFQRGAGEGRVLNRVHKAVGIDRYYRRVSRSLYPGF